MRYVNVKTRQKVQNETFCLFSETTYQVNLRDGWARALYQLTLYLNPAIASELDKLPVIERRVLNFLPIHSLLLACSKLLLIMHKEFGSPGFCTIAIKYFCRFEMCTDSKCGAQIASVAHREKSFLLTM